ncbi:MAG: YceI family protein [Kiritimatiellae bacterium]|nr:YceI family protein [Kiritimatiellia bacterium]MDW8458166.1 YceI family protein [Verrucomicrobiota bacterium]
MKKLSAVFALIAIGFSGALRAATYEVDPSHSHIGFAVRHMVVATVRGTFDEYVGSFNYDPENPANFSASATIKTASINTRNAKRDDHLRSPDFFDAEQFPEIKFETTGAELAGDQLVVRGNLTMRGVTKEIILPLTFSGIVKDPWGNTRVGFEGSTTINRQDWGISWSKTLDTGGLVVSDDVKIELSVEGIQKSE